MELPIRASHPHPGQAGAGRGGGQEPLHLTPFLKGHTPDHTGRLQRPHQAAAVVHLAVLVEEQADGPTGGHPWHLSLQIGPLQGLPEGRRGIGLPFGGAAKRHHDARGLEAAGEPTVGFDARYPAGDEGQTGLAQGQQGAR